MNILNSPDKGGSNIKLLQTNFMVLKRVRLELELEMIKVTYDDILKILLTKWNSEELKEALRQFKTIKKKN